MLTLKELRQYDPCTFEEEVQGGNISERRAKRDTWLMAKGRRVEEVMRSLRRKAAGSPEPLDANHIFYEEFGGPWGWIYPLLLRELLQVHRLLRGTHLILPPGHQSRREQRTRWGMEDYLRGLKPRWSYTKLPNWFDKSTGLFTIDTTCNPMDVYQRHLS